LAYALIDGVASGGFRHGPRDEEPSELPFTQVPRR
jgi:hypothetical protein